MNEIVKDIIGGAITITGFYGLTICTEYFLNRHLPEDVNPDENLSHLVSKLEGFANKTKERVSEITIQTVYPFFELVDKYYPKVKEILTKEIII